MQTGHWQRARSNRLIVHDTFRLPFIEQRNARDHRTRTRVVGGREVLAFEYFPEFYRPESAYVEVALAKGGMGTLRGLTTRLSRGLEQFLVTDDYFSVLPKVLGLPRARVALPSDSNPFDGRVWSAHGDAGLIESVITAPVWQLLDHRDGGGPLSLFTDGEWLLWLPHTTPGRRSGADADLLAAVADLIEADLARGLLDPWTIDHTEHLGRWRGTSFSRIAPLRSVLFYLWSIRSQEYLGDMITGHHAGVDFIAVDGPRPHVLVALEHRVPDHVMLARARLFANRGIDTEWHDFNRDYLVTASHRRIGHAVATPRLIQYLYDTGVDRIDVQGPWVSTSTVDFEPDTIRRTVELLARTRDCLPSFPVGDLAIG